MIYKIKKGQISQGEPIGVILMDSDYPCPPGVPGNATTFSFPVRYSVVKGADMEHLVYKGDPALLDSFKKAGWELVKAGVKAITGNCGFMVLYQDELAKEFPVPVFMSSLLQLPFMARMLQPDEKIGIITASLDSLTDRHIQAATRGVHCPIKVVGMEKQKYFYESIHVQTGELDFENVEREVVEKALELIEGDDKIGVILLECTDLPPYAAAVQEAVNLPTFDVSTMINYVFSTLVRRRFEGYV